MIFISMEEVKEGTEELRFQLAEEDFWPDRIISIAPRGLPIATILSSLLNLKKVYSICIMEHVVYYPIPSQVFFFGEKVLILDDICRTGKTLDMVNKKYSKYQQEHLTKTACLFKEEGSLFKPDFYFATINKQVLLPWETI